MSRDNELVRELLLEAERDSPKSIMCAMTLNPSEEMENRWYHLQLLCDQGLMTHRGRSFYRLTNDGHDFAEAIKSNKIWSKTKQAVGDAGGTTIDILKQVAVGYLKQEISQKIGVSL